jgi:hypothetical protein
MSQTRLQLRWAILALLLAACTRSVDTSPVASPPVTVMPATSASPAAAETQPAGEATSAPVATQAPGGSRLPSGQPAAEPLPLPEGSWAIWRRGTDAGQLFRADASGQVVEVRLPALEGLRPSPEFILAEDGQLILYSLLDASGGVIARELAVYEFATGRLQTVALDPETYNLVDYGVLQGSFDPAGTQVAFTLEGFLPNDTSQAQFMVYIWDLQANELREAFNPRTPVNRNLIPEGNSPLVVRWMPEGILLTSHVYQSTTYNRTLLWEPDGGRITEAADPSAAFAFQGSRLAGGAEVMWPDYDASYPALPLDCWGSQTPENVLKVVDVTAAEPETQIVFAAGASEQIGRARWLDGGERLALLMVGCDGQASRLLAIDRRGAVGEAVPVTGALALFTAGSEVILLQEDTEAFTTTITAYDGQQNWAERQVASFGGILGAGGYPFSFSGQGPAAAGLRAFPEVDAEASLSGLQIGRRATVASSSGVLNIRTEPNPDAPALGLLASGDEVTILDGPVNAENGLVYWQVESDNGLVGWCVEAVEGEQTLIPKP